MYVSQHWCPSLAPPCCCSQTVCTRCATVLDVAVPLLGVLFAGLCCVLCVSLAGCLFLRHSPAAHSVSTLCVCVATGEKDAECTKSLAACYARYALLSAWPESCKCWLSLQAWLHWCARACHVCIASSISTEQKIFWLASKQERLGLSIFYAIYIVCPVLYLCQSVCACQGALEGVDFVSTLQGCVVPHVCACVMP